MPTKLFRGEAISHWTWQPHYIPTRGNWSPKLNLPYRVKEMCTFTCWCKCKLNCVSFPLSCFVLWILACSSHHVFFVLNGLMAHSRQLGIWNSPTSCLKMTTGTSNIQTQGGADMVNQPREIIQRHFWDDADYSNFPLVVFKNLEFWVDWTLWEISAWLFPTVV